MTAVTAATRENRLVFVCAANTPTAVPPKLSAAAWLRRCAARNALPTSAPAKTEPASWATVLLPGSRATSLWSEWPDSSRRLLGLVGLSSLAPLVVEAVHFLLEFGEVLVVGLDQLVVEGQVEPLHVQVRLGLGRLQPVLHHLEGLLVAVQRLEGLGGAEVGLDVGGVVLEDLVAVEDALLPPLLLQLAGRDVGVQFGRQPPLGACPCSAGRSCPPSAAGPPCTSRRPPRSCTGSRGRPPASSPPSPAPAPPRAPGCPCPRPGSGPPCARPRWPGGRCGRRGPAGAAAHRTGSWPPPAPGTRCSSPRSPPAASRRRGGGREDAVGHFDLGELEEVLRLLDARPLVPALVGLVEGRLVARPPSRPGRA